MASGKRIAAGLTGAALWVATSTGAAFAAAQDASTDDGAITVSGEVSVVTGAVDGDVESDADASLSITGTHILPSGVELGAVTSLRADADQPANTFAGGRFSSLLAGGTRGFGDDDADLFLEGAYLFARGGFGTLHVGRDSGVASRLAVTSPTIFRAIGVNDWRSDLTGLNDVHTVNDFSGQATKFSYMPPPGLLGGAIGQVQVGVSYAPELDPCGSDRCRPQASTAARTPSAVSSGQQWRDVVEAAFYYQKGFSVGAEPVRFGVSASYVRADDDGPGPAAEAIEPLLGDYRAYGFGLNLGVRNVTVGGSVKTTNAGLNPDRDEDYLAFDAGVTYEAGEWNFMLGYGLADAGRDAATIFGPAAAEAIGSIDRFDRETQTAQAGISYVFDHGVTLGAAAQFVDSEKDKTLGGNEDAAAFLIESSIKF